VAKTIKTDNCSPFNSEAFRQFASYCGFEHRRITPRWPKANAQAEGFNKPLMKSIKSSHIEQTNWKQEMFRFLRQYRATPHVSTGYTPFRLMFQREPNTRLPEIQSKKTEIKIDEMVRQKDERAKSRSKEYSDTRNNASRQELGIGDKVLLENENQTKLTSKYLPEPFVIEKKKGNMVTATNETKTITRNMSQFKKVNSDLQPAQSYNWSHEDQNIDSPETSVTDNGITQNRTSPRPVRNRREPGYLKDYVRKVKII
jgi:hypothetical protein